MKSCWPDSLRCAVLGLSVSRNREHQRRQQWRRPSLPGAWRVREEVLLAHLRAIHAEACHDDGWPRMAETLCARGHRAGTKPCGA